MGLKRTSRLERREEGRIDFPSAVDSQAIDAVIRHETGDPALPHIQHISIFGPHIREGDGVISFPADLDAVGVIVVNETEGVKVRFLYSINLVKHTITKVY